MASSRMLYLILVATVATLGVASCVEGQVLFSTLPKSLVVTAALPDGKPIGEVKTGEDSILVKWTVNSTASVDAVKLKTKLCFASESQVLRGWRATNDDLKKDKTCLYDIATQDFSRTGGETTYKLSKSIPGAKYFVRAYAINAEGKQVATGQTSPNKVANTFTVIPISGRSTSIDIAVGVLSIFSVSALFGFFIFESIYLKRKKAV
ncbi:high-affinity nitrate transporter-activating protein 2.1 [Physcomitrium patens]|uniref:High-affinity nitrate transporter n=1 Tax=Physcomitrium patens TaxID=3218 RepID=Q4LEX2_PHYPA|nr:high-affinity nitrate transporter-activating protein 2.1-like [Physcomitrium patens]PNR34784.1 hypothetical protein PHYPA_022682 [Physcomitrium patens]BAE06053.1 putative component of high affinity nitrate transporter [Physcomitrium patens]BAE45931.1 putative component of high affinity nitrate transporter [Physcomitrium patens]|eukprot:XP_024401800.1 high-affinity nitrate transporter-activating protein 2.1-like [Physcomitrella patens]